MSARGKVRNEERKLSFLSSRFYDDVTARKDRQGVNRRISLANIMRGRGVPAPLIRDFLDGMPSRGYRKPHVELLTPPNIPKMFRPKNEEVSAGTRVTM